MFGIPFRPSRKIVNTMLKNENVERILPPYILGLHDQTRSLWIKDIQSVEDEYEAGNILKSANQLMKIIDKYPRELITKEIKKRFLTIFYKILTSPQGQKVLVHFHFIAKDMFDKNLDLTFDWKPLFDLEISMFKNNKRQPKYSINFGLQNFALYFPAEAIPEIIGTLKPYLDVKSQYYLYIVTSLVDFLPFRGFEEYIHLLFDLWGRYSEPQYNCIFLKKVTRLVVRNLEFDWKQFENIFFEKLPIIINIPETDEFDSQSMSTMMPFHMHSASLLPTVCKLILNLLKTNLRERTIQFLRDTFKIIEVQDIRIIQGFAIQLTQVITDKPSAYGQDIRDLISELTENYFVQALCDTQFTFVIHSFAQLSPERNIPFLLSVIDKLMNSDRQLTTISYIMLNMIPVMMKSGVCMDQLPNVMLKISDFLDNADGNLQAATMQALQKYFLCTRITDESFACHVARRLLHVESLSDNRACQLLQHLYNSSDDNVKKTLIETVSTENTIHPLRYGQLGESLLTDKPTKENLSILSSIASSVTDFLDKYEEISLKIFEGALDPDNRKKKVYVVIRDIFSFLLFPYPLPIKTIGEYVDVKDMKVEWKMPGEREYKYATKVVKMLFEAQKDEFQKKGAKALTYLSIALFGLLVDYDDGAESPNPKFPMFERSPEFNAVLKEVFDWLYDILNDDSVTPVVAETGIKAMDRLFMVKKECSLYWTQLKGDMTICRIIDKNSVLKSQIPAFAFNAYNQRKMFIDVNYSSLYEKFSHLSVKFSSFHMSSNFFTPSKTSRIENYKWIFDEAFECLQKQPLEYIDAFSNLLFGRWSISMTLEQYKKLVLFLLRDDLPTDVLHKTKRKNPIGRPLPHFIMSRIIKKNPYSRLRERLTNCSEIAQSNDTAALEDIIDAVLAVPAKTKDVMLFKMDIVSIIYELNTQFTTKIGIAELIAQALFLNLGDCQRCYILSLIEFYLENLIPREECTEVLPSTKIGLLPNQKHRSRLMDREEAIDPEFQKKYFGEEEAEKRAKCCQVIWNEIGDAKSLAEKIHNLPEVFNITTLLRFIGPKMTKEVAKELLNFIDDKEGKRIFNSICSAIICNQRYYRDPLFFAELFQPIFSKYFTIEAKFEYQLNVLNCAHKQSTPFIQEILKVKPEEGTPKGILNFFYIKKTDVLNHCIITYDMFLLAKDVYEEFFKISVDGSEEQKAEFGKSLSVFASKAYNYGWLDIFNWTLQFIKEHSTVAERSFYYSMTLFAGPYHKEVLEQVVNRFEYLLCDYKQEDSITKTSNEDFCFVQIFSHLVRHTKYDPQRIIDLTAVSQSDKFHYAIYLKALYSLLLCDFSFIKDTTPFINVALDAISIDNEKIKNVGNGILVYSIALKSDEEKAALINEYQSENTLQALEVLKAVIMTAQLFDTVPQYVIDAFEAIMSKKRQFSKQINDFLRVFWTKNTMNLTDNAMEILSPYTHNPSYIS